MNRDELRAAIFAKKNLKKERITMFGMEVDIVQPTLRDIVKAQQEPDESRSITHLLINYCRVPETGERVFEPGDEEKILELPFDEGLKAASDAFKALMDLTEDVEEAEGNSAASPMLSQPS